ncbi:MAG TPA: LLM class flavin-dependent oxidoreductase, partial [Dehalococcoidia bacterium]|nr:LLM class flavin-dependent oxidoreductase [Dehalococcoidia bacterium]
MKIEMFHLCPYRDLPEDFREKNRSVWVDVPSHLFDAEIASRTYNETLDELMYGAEMGYDGICVNEHHQNAYGLMPSPNIMAAAMSRETEDVAIIVMGNSIALYDPPIRVAEEMAMLDCISGGRLVAGFPVGSAMDTAYGYGANPALLRDKYAEAEELILRAWEEKEMFSFDGKYTQ